MIEEGDRSKKKPVGVLVHAIQAVTTHIILLRIVLTYIYRQSGLSHGGR